MWSPAACLSPGVARPDFFFFFGLFFQENLDVQTSVLVLSWQVLLTFSILLGRPDEPFRHSAGDPGGCRRQLVMKAGAGAAGLRVVVWLGSYVPPAPASSLAEPLCALRSVLGLPRASPHPAPYPPPPPHWQMPPSSPRWRRRRQSLSSWVCVNDSQEWAGGMSHYQAPFGGAEKNCL